MKIADVIPHDGIELKYLFVSRKSLILPYLYEKDKNDFLKLFKGCSLRNIKTNTILSSIGLTRHNIDLDGISDVIRTKKDEESVLELVFSNKNIAKLNITEKYN